jgi:hypothetical protein
MQNTAKSRAGSGQGEQASLEYGAREHKRYLAEPIPGDKFMQKDIETLTTLNHDFVKSVQGADVKRFDEILAKDFLFTNPDGSLYNRAEFLDLIGKGARISELREDQVNVRLFWDFAIIHARIQYRSKAGIERSGSACPRIPPARISEAAGAETRGPLREVSSPGGA